MKVKLSKKGLKLVRKVKRGKKIKFAVSVAVLDAAGIGATRSARSPIKRR